jgi:hypothetical protein
LKIRESIKNGKFNEFYKRYFNLLNY